MVTQQRLIQLFSYSPETGEFTFLSRPDDAFATPRAAAIFKTKCLGKVAGWAHASGYVSIKVDEGSYLAHRLAWLYMTGNMPPHEVDHINGNRSDNRFVNLRAVTKLENSHNQSLRVTNKSGATGVFWEVRRNMWLATILNAGKSTHLGYFKTFEEACAARKGAERALKFDKGHGKPPVDPRYYKPRRSLGPSRISPDIEPGGNKPEN